MEINTFKVEEWMNEYEKYCKYDLGNTTINTLSLDELFEITKEDKQKFLDCLCKKTLGYGDIKGNPLLKREISKLYDSLTEDDILTTSGAAGANHLVFYSLVEPKDEVISVTPTYQQLYSIPSSFMVNVKLLKLKKENSFLPNIDELKKLITKNTKLICLNNPNNPTGALINKELLEEIINIAKKVNAYILCDEVYRGLNTTDEKTPSIVDLYTKGISTSSMSKIFSLAGLRLGWVASKDKSFMQKCMSHREYSLISCPIAEEAIATLALKNAEKIIKRNKKTITENLKILDNWVKNEKFVNYIKPKAGTTALIFYDANIKSSKLCDILAKEKGVFLTPGECFDMEYCFRIGYCKSKPQELKQGLDEISRLLQELNF